MIGEWVAIVQHDIGNRVDAVLIANLNRVEIELEVPRHGGGGIDFTMGSGNVGVKNRQIGMDARRHGRDHR